MASPASLVLIIGYVAAIGLGALELQRGTSLALPPAPPEQAAQAVPPLEMPPDVIRSIAAYDGIIERPLFSPDRRPETPAQAEGPADDPQPPVGTVEIDGFRLTAVLRDANNTTVLIEDQAGQTRALHAGDPLGNWRLDEVLDDRVVLVAGDRQETLMVYDFSVPAADKTARRAYRRITRQPRLRPVPAERAAPAPPNQP